MLGEKGGKDFEATELGAVFRRRDYRLYRHCGCYSAVFPAGSFFFCPLPGGYCFLYSAPHFLWDGARFSAASGASVSFSAPVGNVPRAAFLGRSQKEHFKCSFHFSQSDVPLSAAVYSAGHGAAPAVLECGWPVQCPPGLFSKCPAVADSFFGG